MRTASTLLLKQLSVLLALCLLLVQPSHAKERIRYHINGPDGSTLRVVDQKGVAVAAYRYAPFGTQLIRKKTRNLHGAQGFVTGIHEANNLVYLKHRYYNPVIGRFYQPDPVTFLSGGMGQINRYQYGWNDPLTFKDPNGLAAKVVDGVWVDDGTNFYSASGSEFVDRIAKNFLSDLSILAPLPKIGFLQKFGFTGDVSLAPSFFQSSLHLDLEIKNFTAVKMLPNSGLGFQVAGRDIIKWGSGPEDALLRSRTISAFEADSILRRIPAEDIIVMRDFYLKFSRALPFEKVIQTPTPLYRAALMDNILIRGGYTK